MRNKSYTIEKAQKLLENYCSYQERSHKEVIEKLRNVNIISIGIDQIVSSLIQNNYLNEERFAKSFSRGKFRIKGWGKTRITFKLRQHLVSDFNIKVGLEEIDDEEYIKTLNKLSSKIWKSSKGEDSLDKRKMKFISTLKYKGWESNLIYDQLNKIEKNLFD